MRVDTGDQFMIMIIQNISYVYSAQHPTAKPRDLFFFRLNEESPKTRIEADVALFGLVFVHQNKRNPVDFNNIVSNESHMEK